MRRRRRSSPRSSDRLSRAEPCSPWRVGDRQQHPSCRHPIRRCRRRRHRAVGPAQQRGPRRRLRRRAQGLRAGVRHGPGARHLRVSPTSPTWSTRYAATTQIRETSCSASRPSSPSRHVTARVAPLGTRLVLALVEDRTRERRVEAVRRDFVANVSHELKTPVGAIRLLAEAVHDAAYDPEAVKALLRPDAHRERPALAAGAAGHRALAAAGRRAPRPAGAGRHRRGRQDRRRHQCDRRRREADLGRHRGTLTSRSSATRSR